MNNKEWQSKNRIAVFTDQEQYYNLLAAEFLEKAEKCMSEKGCFIAVLGGGNSPAYVNARIVKLSSDYSINWKQVYIILSDERYVETSSQYSNHRMIMATLCEPLGINPPYQVYQPDATVAKAAERYDAYMEELLREKNQKGFDYAMLGVGNDGHTASLFPGRQALAGQGKLAAPGGQGLEGAERISLSYEALNHCNEISFLINTREKLRILELMKTNWNPLEYPIQNITALKNMYVLAEE